jgi:hypothetical protein
MEFEGRELDSCCEEDGVDERGTPQSSQTWVEEGLWPGGFRFLFPQTSHSHKPESGTPDVPGMESALLEDVLLAFILFPMRYRVILDEEVNKPA